MAVALRITPDALYPFLGYDRHHHKRGDRIGPPPAEGGIESDANRDVMSSGLRRTRAGRSA